MNKKYKLVFFDFCETLVKFQTADRYVDFCRAKLHHKRMILIQFVTELLTRLFFFRIANRIFPHNTWRKSLILSQLKNVDYNTLNRLAKEYYEKCIKTAVIPRVMECLKSHLDNGDEVWIISGGYDLYIRYFVAEYHLTGFICTQIAFSNENICKGKIAGLDCMCENKVVLMREKFGDLLDKEEIVAYSDSCSDLPLLMLAGEGWVISRQCSQNWVVMYNLKEIIWR